MKTNAYIRIFLDILVFAFIINAWWFIALPIALVCAWFFSYYLELIIAGIAYDSLFGMVGIMGIWGYGGTIISLTLFLVVVFLKKVMRR